MCGGGGEVVVFKLFVIGVVRDLYVLLPDLAF